ncbi:MAG: anhydro-N-acetylmuramic acid kinase [Candidatus Muproteobacteria bacterium RBG_16_65_34]|uniref:Anhydro-N-acetylmuramic acid kinase n=1 Tax=Candidatus Muproteobacteria bacterium RBG_16_65_34 TaxID=1817760 RepID=A0A1F6TTF0_9PROT|nr:MAG: anhydro-N-acetylmuramic acid kinase [Candidatus Muproteobacteria bacterium RBG_16_65_34]
MYYIGLMSGTSVDGIDAALVSITNDAGLTLIATHAHPFPHEARQKIHALSHPGANELAAAGELDMQLGELFAEAAREVLAKAGMTARDIRAIGSHGQTLRHHPNSRHPFTLQIGNPSVIAERTGIATVADFRSRDIAAGGQGAPLVPAFHHWLFHSPAHHRVILNIGGIANVTYLPADASQSVLGFDTGPGNTLLDQWTHRHLAKHHDEDGRWAAGGRCVQGLLERLLHDPFFGAPPPKSTGREHFNLVWLDSRLDALEQKPTPQDVQATLLELTARTVADAILRFLPRVDEIYVCGGGSHNRALMAALKTRLPDRPIATTEALGLTPDWVEAVAFAWLAHRTLEGLPGNLPSVTGARRAVILGGIYKA